MPPIILPIEIEETILDILAEDDEGHSALKMCSLVCHAFLPICRKHIFETIVLNASDDKVTPSPTTHAFDRLLCETPEIADYIRKLDCNIRNADLTNPSIQISLKRISRLEFLAVSLVDSSNPAYGARLDWSNNPIRPALLHLLHLPTLTQLVVSESCINNFLVSDLIPCVNLKYLYIGSYTTVPMAAKNTFPHAALPEHSIQLEEFVAVTRCPAAIMKLCTARRPDGQPIIDFRSLSKITVDIEKPIDGETLQMLFRCCHALTDVHINCK